MAEASPKCPRHRSLGPSAVHRSAFVHLLSIGMVLTATVAGAVAFGLPFGFAAAVIAGYALLTTYVARFVADHAPHARFGKANGLTLVRGAIACLLGGLVVVAPHAPPPVLWAATVGGFAALALDGLDGLIARRYGEVSRFGAAFDMETDALIILLLSVLMYRLDRAGAWVLAIGLMRYAFVVAGWVWPRLTAPLPASSRRKAICVVQVAVPIACIPAASSVAASRLALAAALLALGISFAIDVIWLLRHGDEAARQKVSLTRQILPNR